MPTYLWRAIVASSSLLKSMSAHCDIARSQEHQPGLNFDRINFLVTKIAAKPLHFSSAQSDMECRMLYVDIWLRREKGGMLSKIGTCIERACCRGTCVGNYAWSRNTVRIWIMCVWRWNFYLWAMEEYNIYHNPLKRTTRRLDSTSFGALYLDWAFSKNELRFAHH